MSKIQKESVTHDILRLAKMLRKPIDVHTVRNVYGYIDRDSKVRRSFETLYRYGYVDVVGPECVTITSAGIDQVYKMATPGRAINDD